MNVGAPHLSRENARHEEERQGMESQKSKLFFCGGSQVDVAMAQLSTATPGCHPIAGSDIISL